MAVHEEGMPSSACSISGSIPQFAPKGTNDIAHANAAKWSVCNDSCLRRPKPCLQLLSWGSEATFLTLRIDFTWAVLDAWGPPFCIDWEISSEYILHSKMI